MLGSSALSAPAKLLSGLLYGHALYLPPSTSPSKVYVADSSIAACLEPFRRRLHRQRVAVTILRALSAAAIAVVLLLLARLIGIAVPVPQFPLAVGVVVVLMGCCAAWSQLPTAPQMAEALDDRLGLRQQLGTALETDPHSGRMAAGLHQRARKTLSAANAEFVLPWPSLKLERVWLLASCLMVAVVAAATAHAPLPSHDASAPAGAHSVSSRRVNSVVQARRSTAMPMTLHALGQIGFNQGVGAVRIGRSGNSSRFTSGRTQAGGRFQTGAPQGLHATAGSGHGTPLAGSGSQTGMPGPAGSQSGSGTALQLTTGRNSSTGGVQSQSQQALMNLQHSISSANAQEGQQSSSTQGQAARSGGPQDQTQGGAGRQAGGDQRLMGRGHYAARNQLGARAAPGSAAGSNSADPRGSSRQSGRIGGDGDPTSLLRPGSAPGGLGDGGRTAAANQGGSSTGARLGVGGDVVLNGTAGQGGRMILTAGLPNRGLGVPGASLAGAASAPLITVPGYVAPDDNSVAPDARSAVQGYFSPPPNSGQ